MHLPSPSNLFDRPRMLLLAGASLPHVNKRRISMKWFTLSAAIMVCCFSANAEAGFGLLKKHSCGCAPEPSCCAPEPSCCAPEPSCCAPEPSCCAPEPTCCAPEPSCCAPEACGPACEPTCAAPAPTCCTTAPSCAAPSCAAPACCN